MNQMWSQPCKNAGRVQEAGNGSRSDASRISRGLWGLAQLGGVGKQRGQPRGGEDGQWNLGSECGLDKERKVKKGQNSTEEIACNKATGMGTHEVGWWGW